MQGNASGKSIQVPSVSSQHTKNRHFLKMRRGAIGQCSIRAAGEEAHKSARGACGMGGNAMNDSVYQLPMFGLRSLFHA